MPHVEIKCYPGRTEEVKQACAEEIKKVVVEKLGCPSEKVSVIITEIKPENWKEEVWDKEITNPEKKLYVKPGYKCE